MYSTLNLLVFLIGFLPGIKSRPSETQNSKQFLHFDLQNDDTIGTFGNEKTIDYYRLLEIEGNNLIVGAADNFLNLTIKNTNSKIEIIKNSNYYWPAERNAEFECNQKAANSEDCRNFIRILTIHTKTDDVLICGTHAYKPKCRIYDPKTKRTKKEFSGTGLSPLDPK
uniref:Sema domain-containing protein n=1 Tax=Panagrolaimus sp. JU765 TaxID=591449 RepID=A0AC34RNM8_9BILA